MKNSITEIKKELIEWVLEIDDLETIQELLDIKNKDSRDGLVAEAQPEYAVKDDFDERFVRGLTSAESRKRTREFIEKLPWKK